MVTKQEITKMKVPLSGGRLPLLLLGSSRSAQATWGPSVLCWGHPR